MTRPTWDETWLHVAAATAARSLCVRAKVGAAIADVENKIVSVGYNGPSALYQHHELPCDHWCPRAAPGAIALRTDYTDCLAEHAEMNAMSVVDRSRYRDGTIYVLGDVCWACTRHIASSGLRLLVVQTDGADRDYRHPDRSYEYLRSLGIEVDVR